MPTIAERYPALANAEHIDGGNPLPIDGDIYAIAEYAFYLRTPDGQYYQLLAIPCDKPL